MLKSALLASAICFAFVVPASAQSEMKCDEASLTTMRTQIDSMTDKEKQKMTVAQWEAAMAAMKANNMEECNARMADTGKSLMGKHNDNSNGGNSDAGNGEGGTSN